METRASYTIVGAFVLGLIGAAVFFVMWLAGSGPTKDQKVYRIHFDGDVTGLQVGALVRYKGIPVGEVSRLDIHAEKKDIIEAVIRVSPATPLTANTVASLESQGLTGSPFVQLKLKKAEREGAPDPVTVEFNPPDGRGPIIKGEATGFAAVLEELPKTARSIRILAERASELLNDENIKKFGSILTNADGVLASVRGLADEGKVAVKNIGAAADSIKGMAEDIRPSFQSLTRAADNIEPAVEEAKRGLKAFADLNNDLRTVVRENRRPLADFAATGLYEFSLFMTDMRQFVRTFDRLLTRVESDPSGFVFGNRQRGFETQGGRK